MAEAPRVPLCRPTSRRAALLAIAILLAAAFAAGCSLDYGTPLSQALGEGMPDTVLYGFSHVVVRDGSPLFALKAERAEVYEAAGKTRLTGVSFTEYASDGSGTVAAEGRADSAVFHMKTENAELSGAIRYRSVGDGVTIESGYLSWDSESRILSSRLDSVTTLSDEDGDYLSGAGFKADAARRTFSFSEPSHGRLRRSTGDIE